MFFLSGEQTQCLKGVHTKMSGGAGEGGGVDGVLLRTQIKSIVLSRIPIRSNIMWNLLKNYTVYCILYEHCK